MNHKNYFENYFKKPSFEEGTNLYDSETGFLKGNMFKNIYVPYKNYQVRKPVLYTEKDKLMYDIQMYGFGLQDLLLYLDMHPEDSYVVRKFMDLQNKVEEHKKIYESKYGPLNVCSTHLNNTPWPWLKNWPFEVNR